MSDIQHLDPRVRTKRIKNLVASFHEQAQKDLAAAGTFVFDLDDLYAWGAMVCSYPPEDPITYFYDVALDDDLFMGVFIKALKNVLERTSNARIPVLRGERVKKHSMQYLADRSRERAYPMCVINTMMTAKIIDYMSGDRSIVDENVRLVKLGGRYTPKTPRCYGFFHEMMKPQGDNSD